MLAREVINTVPLDNNLAELCLNPSSVIFSFESLITVTLFLGISVGVSHRISPVKYSGLLT